MLKKAWGTFRRLANHLGNDASQKSGWPSSVERVIRDLEALNRSTERDFLTVGGKLREFLTSARKISTDMAALAELISGEQSRKASAALYTIRERATQMGTRMEQGAQRLATIREHSSRVRQAFSKLGETVSTFRTLCTLTRVETARLGDNALSFGDLAEQVKPLSERIQSSGDRVLESLSDLEGNVKVALDNGAELSARELAELHSLVGNVGEGLKSFDERQLRAGEASSRQSAEHAAVCQAIEDLVQSIQFHDITRQQIEHVYQALRQIHSEQHSSAGGDSLAPADVQGMLSLQSSQLASAAQAFRTSIQHMSSDLEGIAARVSDMAEASKTLMGVSEGEKDSFFLRMEGCFTGILKALGVCSEAEAALRTTASGLKTTIQGMGVAVQDIWAIEIQIQRTAINATIGSAHIGGAGSALNVIADVMHRVALDSDSNADNVSGALSAMTEAAELLAAGPGEESSGRAEVTDAAAGQMREAIQELHASSEASFNRVNEIVALSSALSEEIRSLRGGLSVGELFDDVLARAQGELTKMGAGAHPSGAVPMASAQHVERFAKHYTMQSERDVHQRATAGNSSAPAELALASASVTSSELGDNVELF